MMLAGINYSEKDAEFDSFLVFQEIEDLDPVTAMGNSLVSGQEVRSGQKIHSVIMSHLRNIRFTKFSQEALRTELNNLSGNSSSDNGRMKEHSHLTTNEFKHRLQQDSRIFAVEIPNVQQMISEAGLVRVDASMKQLRKDIERDRLIVNGIRMVGAEAGLDAILSKICDICDDIHAECGIPKLGDEVKEFAVLSLLSKASRSHSGGIAFQAAQNLIDPATAMLMPQSAVAPPLKINIHLGAFPPTRSQALAAEKELSVVQAQAQAQGASVRDTENSHPTNSESTGCSSSGTSAAMDKGRGRWGLVCKITGESIFKVQLYDSPVEDGYDDCSTAELEGGEDGAPCLFRPVTVRLPAVVSSSRGNSSSGSSSGSSTHETKATTEEEDEKEGAGGEDGAEGDTETASGAVCQQPSLSGRVGGSMQPPTGTPPCSSGISGICIEGRNTFVSVVYEDYVLFEVKLAPVGELANLENLCDNWRETATVTVTEIEPVRTLL